MADETRREDLDAVRRKLLKSTLTAGGFLAAGHVPYVKPAVKSFFGVRSAWAQPTGVTDALGDESRYFGRNPGWYLAPQALQ